MLAVKTFRLKRVRKPRKDHRSIGLLSDMHRFSKHCFIRFILNVNHNKVFVWENVNLLRLTACGLITLSIVATGDELYTGNSFTEVYDHFFDSLLFGLFSLIVSEVFAVGLKLQEEQDLTI